MKKTLVFLSKKWKTIGFAIGNVISTCILIVFYYTIFALAALPFRLFGKSLKSQAKTSNWIMKEKTHFTLEDIKNEF